MAKVMHEGGRQGHSWVIGVGAVVGSTTLARALAWPHQADPTVWSVASHGQTAVRLDRV